MQIVDVVRRFSKTPLKHRMSKYLLDFMLECEELLKRVRLVSTRAFLPNTMMVAQAGAEGPAFELELGAVEREEIALVDGRLVKQVKKDRALWVHDPVQAVEVLRKYQGIIHVEFKFVGAVPQWYQKKVEVATTDFAKLISEQVELLISGILLKDEIDKALLNGDHQQFRKKVAQYKRVCNSCLWEL